MTIAHSPPLIEATHRPSHLTPDSGQGLLGEDPRVADEAVAERARVALKARLFADSASLAPRIGRFTLLRELGRGGMGIVYVAYDETLDRRVALKLLYDLPTGDPHAQTRLLHEAQAMARLNHPNIAAVYEAGTHDGRVFVAMEFIQGKPLDAWLRERPRPWREVSDVFVQACRGLHAAHAIGLVHRDFKPANCMLGSDGRVRVLDFGLARGTRTLATDTALGNLSTMMSMTIPLAPPSPGPLSCDGLIVGTPAYMPPEQFRGHPIDHRADQFAFCVSLYEALYSRLPFCGDTLPDLWTAVLAGPPGSPPRGAKVPAWLHRLVLRGLDPDPASRFPTTYALLTALERRPSRRLRGGLLAGIVVGGIAGGVYGVQQLNDARCQFGEEDLAGVWDADRKTALRNTLTAGSAPLRYDAWATAENELDQAAGRWLAVQHDACVTHQHEKSSAIRYDRETQCLFRYRQALTAAVDTLFYLEDPTPNSVRTALVMLNDQPDCTAETIAEWNIDPPPSDKKDAVDRLYGELFTIESRAFETVDEAVLKTLRRISSEAEALEYRSLMVDAARLRSAFEAQAGLWREACESIRESFFLAESTGRDFQAAYSASHTLNMCRDPRAGGMVDVNTWARLALSNIESAGHGGSPVHMVILFQIINSLLLDAPDAAVPYLLQGIDLLREHPDLRNKKIGNIRVSDMFFICFAQYFSKAPDDRTKRDVRERYDRLLQQFLETDKSSFWDLKRLEFDFSERILRGQWTEAAATASRGLALSLSQDQADMTTIVKTSSMLVSALLSLGRCNEVLAHVDRLEAMKAEIGSLEYFDQVSVYSAIVSAHAQCGSLASAHAALIVLGTLAKDDIVGALSLDMATAIYEAEAGMVKQAAERIERISQTHVLILQRSSFLAIGAHALLAALSVRARQFEKARSSAERAITMIRKEWGPTNLALASPLAVLGEVELHDGNPALAIEHLELAISLGDGSDPQFKARAEFALARALAGTSNAEAHARIMAEAALGHYTAGGPRYARERAEIEAWLAAL